MIIVETEKTRVSTTESKTQTKPVSIETTRPPISKIRLIPLDNEGRFGMKKNQWSTSTKK